MRFHPMETKTGNFPLDGKRNADACGKESGKTLSLRSSGSSEALATTRERRPEPRHERGKSRTKLPSRRGTGESRCSSHASESAMLAWRLRFRRAARIAARVFESPLFICSPSRHSPSSGRIAGWEQVSRTADYATTNARLRAWPRGAGVRRRRRIIRSSGKLAGVEQLLRQQGKLEA